MFVHLFSKCRCRCKKFREMLKDCGWSLTADLYVEAETLHFLDQHVERLRRARFERIIAFDDRFVDAGASLHVVGFHGQQFLQCVTGAVTFEGPDSHFPTTLPAAFSFSADCLL